MAIATNTSSFCNSAVHKLSNSSKSPQIYQKMPQNQIKMKGNWQFMVS